MVPDEQSMGIENWPWPVKISLLGRFEISVDGKPVQFSGKVQKKPLLLLKALVALGKGEVKAEKLEDVLWPESDGDVAHQSFETTLHRLRKLIGCPNALDFSSGLAALNRGVCWTDVWVFENLLEEAGNQERQGRVDRAVDLTEKAVSLYKGMFLPGETGEPWTVSPRERLRRKFLGAIQRLGRQWEEAGEWEKALSCYDRGLQVDDISEEFYQQTMVCYQCLGRIAQALDTYERCKRVLSAVLGVKPSPRTEAIRKSLL
jgi:DNA-binding SARP family transcriptional activator